MECSWASTRLIYRMSKYGGERGGTNNKVDEKLILSRQDTYFISDVFQYKTEVLRPYRQEMSLAHDSLVLLLVLCSYF